jgi:hypothetical protein
MFEDEDRGPDSLEEAVMRAAWRVALPVLVDRLMAEKHAAEDSP